MPGFRRVDASRAGARAVGILVPPGEETLVIVRPRPLAWDLLPARWNGDSATPPAFCRFSRDEAANIARRLQRSLEEAVARGSNPIETLGDPQGSRVQICVRADELFWILCSRALGQAYRPVLFPSLEEAENAARELVPFVWPAVDAEQEFYFNTQNFVTTDRRAGGDSPPSIPCKTFVQ